MKISYCLNCMRQITNENETCPNCGVNNSNIQNDYYCLPAGTILKGRYLAGKMLGQGGFGITYVGYDSLLNLKVAIKEYYPQINVSRNSTQNNSLQFSGSEEAQKRHIEGKNHFLKEARRIAAVNDVPNIVSVLDVFEENETAYIIMEFAEGINLKQYLLTKGTLGIKQCLELFTPLLNSLAAVHKRDIIHRDISPDNIMLSPNQELKLIDFGASKEVSSGVSSEQVIKRGFSPAEQYGGSGATGSWSDVYSICATIYYCVTGKVIPEAMDRVIEDTLSFDLPLEEPFSPAQIQALKKGLAVKPQDRTQTMDELLKALALDGKKTDPAKTEPEIQRPAADNTAGESVAADSEETDLAAEPEGSKKWYQKPITIILLLAVLGGAIFIGAKFFMAGNWEKNQLRADFLAGSDYSKEDITEVFFLDSLKEQGRGAWDVSEDQSGSVMAWVKETNNEVKLYIGAKGGINGELAASGMFSEYGNLKEINFNDCLHLDYATDMSYMFSLCESLTSLDLSNFDTSQVTDMLGMFASCESLTSLDLSNFDTSQVTDMLGMFASCESLTELNVSSFNTSQVTNMIGMFVFCEKMKSLDVSNFDTSKATNMYSMFSGCESLTSLNVSNFDTSQVNDMSEMFSGCYNLTSLDLSSFDTSQVNNMSGMFSLCLNLTTLDVSNFDTSQVNDMSDMFSCCHNLTSLDLSNFDTSQVNDMSDMFSLCLNLTTLDVSNFDTSQVTDMSHMFMGCASLTMLDISNFDTSKADTTDIFLGSNFSQTELGM